MASFWSCLNVGLPELTLPNCGGVQRADGSFEYPKVNRVSAENEIGNNCDDDCDDDPDADLLPDLTDSSDSSDDEGDEGGDDEHTELAQGKAAEVPPRKRDYTFKRRKRPEVTKETIAAAKAAQEKRAQREKNNLELSKAQLHSCCMRETSVAHFDQALTEKRRQYQEKTMAQRRSWLATVISASTQKDPISQGNTAVFTSGFPECIPLCKSCFYAFNGVPYTTYYRITSAAQRGRQTWESLPRGPQSQAESERALIGSWITGYAKRSGDFMPNKASIHLGEFEWRPVFNKCLTELKAVHLNFNIDHFNRIRRAYCPEIKLRSRNQCGKCDQCTKLRQLYTESTGAEKERYRKAYETHLQWKDEEKAVCIYRFHKCYYSHFGCRTRQSAFEKQQLQSTKSTSSWTLMGWTRAKRRLLFVLVEVRKVVYIVVVMSDFVCRHHVARRRVKNWESLRRRRLT